MTPRLQSLVSYYADRLALIYRDRMKAQAVTRLFTKNVLGDDLANTVANAYNLDTARGHQLDVIGKYVGLARNIGLADEHPWFGFTNYADGIVGANPHGFTLYEDSTVNFDGVFLQYSQIGARSTDLLDGPYAFLIRLKILSNSSYATLADIQDYLQTFLSAYVRLVDHRDMSMTYHVNPHTPVAPDVLIQYLPKPMGVKVDMVIDPTVSAIAPVFTEMPADQHIASLSTATFHVAVVGQEPITFQWQKNGVDIPGATTDTLTLVSVGSADEGEYTCIASNSAGTVTSDVAVLLLLSTPDKMEVAEWIIESGVEWLDSHESYEACEYIVESGIERTDTQESYEACEYIVETGIEKMD